MFVFQGHIVFEILFSSQHIFSPYGKLNFWYELQQNLGPDFSPQMLINHVCKAHKKLVMDVFVKLSMELNIEPTIC